MICNRLPEREKSALIVLECRYGEDVVVSLVNEVLRKDPSGFFGI